MTRDDLVLGGCGILRAEVRFLIEKNGWPIRTRFLDSTLHCDLGRLHRGLTGLLRRVPAGTLVFYGTCHPQIDALLEDARAVRTEGQNCVEMLLGRERFLEELDAGAYFLLEDWARRWEEVTRRTFGDPRVAREIFQSDRKYLLALRTPCSGDFTACAETAARTVDLPLHWTDVGLDRLEQVLEAALHRSRELRQ